METRHCGERSAPKGNKGGSTMKIDISPRLARVLLEVLQGQSVRVEEMEGFKAQLRACASTDRVRGTGRASVMCAEPRAHIRDHLCTAKCGGVE